MSKLQVDTIVNNNDNGAPTFTKGAVVTGVITATSFSGNGSGLTGAGIGTTGSINTSGIITATSFFGSGANLTGVSGVSTTGSVNTSGIITATSIVVSAGTTALPSISPTGDTNTGIFFPSADTIAVSAGGTERLRVDSSGSLGIGIAPSAKLHVSITGAANASTTNALILNNDNSHNGDNLTTGISWMRTGNNGSYIYTRISSIRTGTHDTDLAFSVNAGGTLSEKLRIDSTGRVLVGTPTATSVAAALGAKFQLSQSSNLAIDYVENTAATGHVYCQYLHFSGQSPNSIYSAFLMCYDTTTQRFAVRGDGGVANYSANNANLSDINAKKDIAPAADTWDCVKEWEIVNYRYKDQPDDANLNLGVIAQQVAESCPEVITIFQEAKDATEDKPAQEERLGLKEQQMYWMAIKALQEAQVRIEQLESAVATLQQS